MPDSLLARVRELAAVADRIIVGIAGPPGAGKTTLAAGLVAALPSAVMVPMDGFHLANAELHRLGRADRKGAPDTFDADGYVALLRRLRTDRDTTVYAPSFDHVMNEPIAGSIPIPPDVRVIVTEGNYLLLWDAVPPLLDLTAYADVEDSAVRVTGLISRQLAKGLSPEAASEWVLRSDEANAALVATTRPRADLIITR
ncbi:nucleoside/nucleotide kinase family protein [Hamadaea tsunoensis]|uniref:nucleoside/nucleotide kinase family protein n=1 Tax=Hamadaea tsunoensis TaxID=53368 RepID=UPI00041DBA3C|nr:nucleoside/nucleotide kinase family protein [Hamadaea tsunoensis]